MNIIEQVTAFAKSPPEVEEGVPMKVNLLPPLRDEAIQELEGLCGGQLDPVVLELLQFCGGFGEDFVDGEEGCMDGIRFMGTMEPAAEEIFPPGCLDHSRTIHEDGFGNCWFYWPKDLTPQLGPVYYFQHEGPMIFYQCASLVEFIQEYIKLQTPPHEGLLDDVHEMRIPSKLSPMSRDEALGKGDPELKAFAGSSLPDSTIFDFRGAQTGDGLDLGAHRLEMESGHATLPILSFSRKPTFFEKLFGKRKK